MRATAKDICLLKVNKEFAASFQRFASVTTAVEAQTLILIHTRAIQLKAVCLWYRYIYYLQYRNHVTFTSEDAQYTCS